MFKEDKKNNTYSKDPRAPSVAENEAEFVIVFKNNILQYPCVHNNFQEYEEVCE